MAQLAEYNRKRNLRITPEPAVRGRRQGGKQTRLLIKARDELAQSAADYEVTAARPESVLSGTPSTHGGGTPRPLGPASPPEFIAPQLATLVAEPPVGAQFVHEIKFDGYRALARVDHGGIRHSERSAGVTIWTRSRNDWTRKFGTIAAALAKLEIDSAYFDGEIVALTETGQSNFQALQNSFETGSATSLYYFIFDLLFLNGHDLRAQPLLQRKALLQEMLANNPHELLRFSSHWSGDGKKFLQQCCRQHLEGMICKDGRQPYSAGRSSDWLKIKCTKRQEFIIVGYTAPKGHRQHLGALLLGVQEPEGHLRYVGRVGTGFSGESLAQLKTQLSLRTTTKSAIRNPPSGRGITWVKPELVCEIEFGHFTKDKLLRQAVFQGLRVDKKPQEVSLELPSARSLRAANSAPTEPLASGNEVTLTHPDKILFPPDGPTKKELADYYARVEGRMWPHVERRPLALLRCPNGPDKGCFFHKHVDERRVEPGLAALALQEKGGIQQYRYLVAPIGLRSLVQLAALELHVWGSSSEDPEHPDQLVFDLDPSPEVGWDQVVVAAGAVRKLLARLKLKSFPKLTGGKGVHIHVPIARRYDWEQIKNFCQTVARQLAEDHPALFTVSTLKVKRTGKIFIDYLRNQRGALYVVPFSPRARPDAPIAAPISWKALPQHLPANLYTVRTIDKYLQTYKRDPWPSYFKLSQPIALLE